LWALERDIALMFKPCPRALRSLHLVNREILEQDFTRILVPKLKLDEVIETDVKRSSPSQNPSELATTQVSSVATLLPYEHGHSGLL